MPEQPERELVDKLIQKTQDDQVDWQQTTVTDQLSANFAGKYVIRLNRQSLGEMILMRVTNTEGEELSKLTTQDDKRLPTLYALARRYARREIDDQLADLINELDKPPHAETHEERARRIDKIMGERDKK